MRKSSFTDASFFPLMLGRRYILRVIQSPTTGSAFGTNLLARLALAPPLVVELVVTDSNGNEIPA